MSGKRNFECPGCGREDRVKPIHESVSMKRAFPKADFYCDHCGFAGDVILFEVKDSGSEVNRVIDFLLGGG